MCSQTLGAAFLDPSCKESPGEILNIAGMAPPWPIKSQSLRMCSGHWDYISSQEDSNLQPGLRAIARFSKVI